MGIGSVGVLDDGQHRSNGDRLLECSVRAFSGGHNLGEHARQGGWGYAVSAGSMKNRRVLSRESCYIEVSFVSVCRPNKLLSKTERHGV